MTRVACQHVTRRGGLACKQPQLAAWQAVSHAYAPCSAYTCFACHAAQRCCLLTYLICHAVQAVAAVNEQLAGGAFRLPGKKVATTIEPACDYYVAEASCAPSRLDLPALACGVYDATQALTCAPKLPCSGALPPANGSSAFATINVLSCHASLQTYHQQYLSKGGRFNRPQSAEKGCKDK